MASPSAQDPVDNDAEDSITRVLPALWRAVVIATRSVKHLPTLPESQIVVVRLLIDQGPLTPGQISAELHLSRPTISNLVRGAETNDLIEREAVTDDRRSVLLKATSHAIEILGAFGRGRSEVVARALSEGDEKDRELMASAVPAMRRLRERLLAIAQSESE